MLIWPEIGILRRPLGLADNYPLNISGIERPIVGDSTVFSRNWYESFIDIMIKYNVRRSF